MSPRQNSRFRIAVALLFPALLSGCDWLPPEADKYWVQLQKEVEALITVATGGRSPLAKNTAPSPSPAPSPEVELYGASAKASKANAELLHEVWKVVLIREPKDRSEFGSLVDTLNQGASFEGIYNGFTHSSDYRELEEANRGASPEAVRTFGEELALLEAELPVPTEFSTHAAQPLARPVDPGEDPAAKGAAAGGGGGGGNPSQGVDVVEFGKKKEAPAAAAVQPAAPESQPSPRKIDVAEAAPRYSAQFVGASIYTLKRILGDEALKVVAAKKDFREKLALWYSKWVLHACSRGVDFGIPQRNKPDEAFHYQWAMSNTEDRLDWEVLNRVHRILNEANRQKQ